MTARPELLVLHGEIALRAGATVAAQPEFPCRKGCDHCCRHLASLPVLTQPEWEWLREGIDALPAGVRAGVLERLAALGPQPARPVCCPLLDAEAGACLVYEHRPVACRTYGFYVERDNGLYCETILSAAQRGEFDHVVWGNHAAVEERLAGMGPPRPLRDWME